MPKERRESGYATAASSAQVMPARTREITHDKRDKQIKFNKFLCDLTGIPSHVATEARREIHMWGIREIEQLLWATKSAEKSKRPLFFRMWCENIERKPEIMAKYNESQREAFLSKIIHAWIVVCSVAVYKRGRKNSDYKNAIKNYVLRNLNGQVAWSALDNIMVRMVSIYEGAWLNDRDIVKVYDGMFSVLRNLIVVDQADPKFNIIGRAASSVVKILIDNEGFNLFPNFSTFFNDAAWRLFCAKQMEGFPALDSARNAVIAYSRSSSLVNMTVGEDRVAAFRNTLLNEMAKQRPESFPHAYDLYSHTRDHLGSSPAGLVTFRNDLHRMVRLYAQRVATEGCENSGIVTRMISSYQDFYILFGTSASLQQRTEDMDTIWRFAGAAGNIFPTDIRVAAMDLLSDLFMNRVWTPSLSSVIEIRHLIEGSTDEQLLKSCLGTLNEVNSKVNVLAIEPEERQKLVVALSAIRTSDSRMQEVISILSNRVMPHGESPCSPSPLSDSLAFASDHSVSGPGTDDEDYLAP